MTQNRFRDVGAIINISINGTKILFDMENITFEIEAYGHYYGCCSFETKNNLNDFVGDTIVDYTIQNTSCEIVDNKLTVLFIVLYTFILESGRSFSIELINRDGGNYEAEVVVNYSKLKYGNIVANSLSKIVIICGLPWSGKSTYMTQNYSNYNQHDDFMSDPFLPIRINNELRLNENIVINESRLCNYNTFLDKYQDLLGKVVSHDQIKIILFKNDPVQCLTNSNGAADEESIISLSYDYRSTFARIQELSSNTNILSVFGN